VSDENPNDPAPTRLNRGLNSYVRRLLVAEQQTINALTFPVLVWHAGANDEVTGWAGTMTGAFLARPRGDEPVVLELRKSHGPANRVATGITLGRADTNDVVICDGSISRFHASFLEDGGQWAVIDAESRNGTWVGPNKLVPHRAMPVLDGSRLRFGSVELAFYLPRSFVRYVREQME
jgi:hypothetical protein